MVTESWHTDFFNSKHVLHLNFKKDTTHVPQIQKYKLSGFVYITLQNGGDSSSGNEIKC